MRNRGAYDNFHESNVALIQGRRLLEGGVYLKFGRDKDFLSTVLLFFRIKLTKLTSFEFDCIGAAALINFLVPLIRVNTVLEWRRHIMSCIWVVCLFGLFQMFKIVLMAKLRFNDYLQWYIVKFLSLPVVFVFFTALCLTLGYRPVKPGLLFSQMSSNKIKSTLVP